MNAAQAVAIARLEATSSALRTAAAIDPALLCLDLGSPWWLGPAEEVVDDASGEVLGVILGVPILTSTGCDRFLLPVFDELALPVHEEGPPSPASIRVVEFRRIERRLVVVRGAEFLYLARAYLSFTSLPLPWFLVAACRLEQSRVLWAMGAMLEHKLGGGGEPS